MPLLPPALAIINKYRNHPEVVRKGHLLPVGSNQKLNSYIKEIADICGVYKKLSLYVGRQTFATTVTLANGVPIETVSKMLGHSTLRMTQHYARILENKVAADMAGLRGRYESVVPRLIEFKTNKLGGSRPMDHSYNDPEYKKLQTTSKGSQRKSRDIK